MLLLKKSRLESNTEEGVRRLQESARSCGSRVLIKKVCDAGRSQLDHVKNEAQTILGLAGLA